MHYHCEIVMPPTDDVEGAVTEILKRFDENLSEDADEDAKYDRKFAFWDYWQIGGRWAGAKQQAAYDPARIEEFYQWCRDEKITVSGLQWGKQELSPSDQIPKVDAKWNEMFRPGSVAPCPLFQHSNRNREPLEGDICKLVDMPVGMKCGRVIFAQPEWDADKAQHTWDAGRKAGFMLADTAWNGCNHMDVDWDGTFDGAKQTYLKYIGNRVDEYAARVTPQDDWLVVTVDYHS